ncbi:ABC transporter substrate-binding protein [Jiella endophytica]|uniref:ABC transporter substrate-binding protein n=1 Tax=Jiella endophytica TaxID=2558362 RepID=A0A4Y8RKT4_9HYPH|nr:ABC transporter substrate-binding protein [Jiella endophytica]TFF23332.1 ABC transporter substrate-binding protein [Jiella endophytica]
MGILERAAKAVATGLVVATIGLGSSAALAQEKVRVALGDVVSVETLAFLVALDRAKDKGLDYELTSFAEEELAIQALVGGQADIGVGTPYTIIQKAKVPLRAVFQMSRLVFFPVAANKYQSWKDLDGQPFTFHARGTGTEAIGDIIAAKEGISFGQRSYVPGSENRIIAMMNGTIDATIVDLANKNLLMAKAGDKFHVLPGLDAKPSDELVFASQKWLDENSDKADILVTELLRTWQEMNDDPSIIETEREKRNLLADQPKEILDEVTPFYKEGVENGLFDPQGGMDAAKADFDFYTKAGQLEGPADSLKVEDFWDLEPLKHAAEQLGG